MSPTNLVVRGEQRRELLTHLVTKHNTAVSVELQRQKEAMREKAIGELQRLRDERMQVSPCPQQKSPTKGSNLKKDPYYSYKTQS